MKSGKYTAFPNTHWSLVRRAGFADGAARREALTVLLERYSPALRSHLRVVRRVSADAADDLLQGFITDRILEKEMLRHADERRGRFRSFLLVSLNNYAISRQRFEMARAAENVSGEELEAERGKGGEGPEKAVETAWARALVRDVLAAMRDECLRQGRDDVWAVFEGRMLADIFEGEEPVSYEELARRWDFASPMQAANLLVTGKRMYARLLRAAVGEYEMEEGEIEAEIADLRRILSESRGIKAAEGRGEEGGDEG